MASTESPHRPRRDRAVLGTFNPPPASIQLPALVQVFGQVLRGNQIIKKGTKALRSSNYNAAQEQSVNKSTATRGSSFPPVTDGVEMDRLIGAPHLFARLRPLRDGLLVEPIGVLTLEPGGTIGGYSNPNEGTWISYIHGQVSGDKAFAFVTSQNSWIPSSTWTQSIGDIPIGYFCDEPEVGQSAQRMCLIPDDPLPSETVIVYLVASCLRFYERTVPVMLAQLFADGIRPDQIKVVVNGCLQDRDSTIEGVEYAFSTHDAWEWTALYEAPLRWRFDYCFLIHDTSIVLPGLRESLQAINGHIAWDHLPATPMARCLLGLYSHSFLMRCNVWLKSIDHIDKKNGVMAEGAGELLLRARSALVIGDPRSNGRARSAEWGETIDAFGTGAPRVRRVFPSIRVDKFIHIGPTSPTSL